MTTIPMTRRYDSVIIHKTVHNYNPSDNTKLEHYDHYVVVLEVEGCGPYIAYVMLGVRSGLVRSATSDC